MGGRRVPGSSIFASMCRALRIVAAVCALAAVDAAGARIVYTRHMPPAHNLGGDDIIVVHAAGETLPADEFLDTFVDRTTRAGLMRMDTVARRQLFARHKPNASAMRRLRRLYPREVYLALDRVECSTSEKSGEGSTYNTDGVRVKRRHRWVDALCHVTVAVLDPDTGRPRVSLDVSGEGTSPRVVQLTDEERAIAVGQAVHMAGVNAADLVTPRRIRESIELSENVPEFHRVIAMINANRLEDARRLLQASLSTRGARPEIHLDIAAISEALGDDVTARRHYLRAAELDPKERRYALELYRFDRRHRPPVRRGDAVRRHY